MTRYTFYNVVLAVIVVSASLWILSRAGCLRRMYLAVRVAVLVTLISYPWDFFAIRVGVWRYPVDPGATIHGVPVNDLAFIWLCTFLASSVLIAASRRHAGGERHPKGKDTRENDAGHERDRSSGLRGPVIEALIPTGKQDVSTGVALDHDGDRAVHADQR